MIGNLFRLDPQGQPTLHASFVALMDSLEYPTWVKWSQTPEATPVMVRISALYPVWYPGTEDYAGKTCEQMWGEAGRLFRLLDYETAVSPGEVVESIEWTPGGITEFCRAAKIAFVTKTGVWYWGEAHQYSGDIRRPSEIRRRDTNGRCGPSDGGSLLFEAWRRRERACASSAVR